MNKTFKQLTLLALIIFAAFSLTFANDTKNQRNKDKVQIAKMLDDFNVAAANADYQKYFNFFAENGIFIGTDATENWDKKSFMIWAKPYFDKKRTWNFKAIERHIFVDKGGKFAWFDELLDTQMKICRGSGVLTKQGKEWKLQQYVLSMTIPNDNVDAVVKIKAPIEEALMKKLSGQ